MSRFAVAKDHIVANLESIVAELLLGKQKFKHRGTWNVRNPFRPGSKEEQMVVWLAGARRGAWKDFVSGDKGDAIGLVAFALTGDVNKESQMAAVEWAEDRYGLRTMDKSRRDQLAAEAATKKAAAEATDSKRRQSSIERARKFFFACAPTIIGTPAEAYLASRNAPISRVPNLGRSLRYRRDCEYWRIDGKPKMPAMIAAMVDEHGKLAACHYTFLRPDGSDKAEVEKAKMMFPETSGLVIRLSDGPTGLSAEKAAKEGRPGIVGLVEGIEDGLSAAIAAPELRMWSCGSLSGFRTVPNHPAVNGWIIFKDNDWCKPQAQEQFDLAVTRLKSFGKPVEVVSMPADWGKDVNDAIRSGW
ncbi:DUF7146 domain-containing protein [Rhizobium panacihumi]|uniref:DUF7146 domain-containing protein n=1 Tax=Rhizobium panacihumi TaxID=2008450 RepID=UPI003D7A8FD6